MIGWERGSRLWGILIRKAIRRSDAQLKAQSLIAYLGFQNELL